MNLGPSSVSKLSDTTSPDSAERPLHWKTDCKPLKRSNHGANGEFVVNATPIRTVHMRVASERTRRRFEVDQQCGEEGEATSPYPSVLQGDSSFPDSDDEAWLHR